MGASALTVEQVPRSGSLDYRNPIFMHVLVFSRCVYILQWCRI